MKNLFPEQELSKNMFYKYLIISILFLSLIASNINSVKMNSLNEISLIFNFGLFKINIIYLFLTLATFIIAIFILNKKLVNKNAIITFIILYMAYHLASLGVSIVKGQEITANVVTIVFYPVFALLFLIKNFNIKNNIFYLLSRIKLFLYLGILIGILAFVAKRDVQFLDLLNIALFYLSFEFFERKNIKAILPVIGLAFVSGFNLTWLFTFLFLLMLAILYYLKHFNFRKIIIIFTVFLLIFYTATFFGLFEYSGFLKFPAKERFSQSELFRSTGRTALWQKYIFKYNSGPDELLFGHGTGFRFIAPPADISVGHLHNIFFDEFYKRGIVGLLLLSFIIIISLKAHAPTYLKVVLMVFLIYGQSDLIIFGGISGMFFWMVLGMLNNIKINYAIENKNLSFSAGK